MKTIFLFFLVFSTSSISDVYDINKFDIKNYKGQVIYLDFWASWCKPCQKSFPWMNDINQRFQPQKFKVITINLDQETSAMNKFLNKIKAEFDIFHDPTGNIAENFKLEAMPTSYLINREGKVVKKHIGFYTKKTKLYESEIMELL